MALSLNKKIKPMALIILDGFGHREAIENNAIALAKTPNLDRFQKDFFHTYISASGTDVGLPGGQMGNSEVGHVNIGAGRVVYQELTRIDKEIAEGQLQKNLILKTAMTSAIKNNKAIHLMGLISPGGVHSHESHVAAMIQMAIDLGAKKVFLHAFLDGRDTPPKSAKSSLQKLDNLLRGSNVGCISSIVGRYFAMDRDQRWDRIKLAYDLLTKKISAFQVENALEGLSSAYARGETDEFVQPTWIESGENITDGDSVIFINFRSDRARQLTHSFIDSDPFNYFDRGEKLNLGHYVTLTEYEAGLPVEVAYPPSDLKNVLGEVIANLGKKQLRIAETEKYAHVTFFLNGGIEKPFVGEDRILIPSPKVATYDLKPEMSAYELTDELVKAILSEKYDLIVCNYANADMVGHTGNLKAAIAAIEALDICLGRVVEALKQVGGEALITADHGNAEQMLDTVTGQPHTAHTTDLVPLIYTGQAVWGLNKPGEIGVLSDLAPTILSLLKINIPKEMTGRVLLV